MTKKQFNKEEKVEIGRDQYLQKTGITKIRQNRAKSFTGCCTVGLLPAIILFIPFMLIYPNKNILYSLINFHRRKASPILNRKGIQCEFTPSCSEYSRLSIKKYGALKGGFKSLYRIARCNPFNNNKGFDYP